VAHARQPPIRGQIAFGAILATPPSGQAVTQAFVDAQIQSHVRGIVAIDLTTESGYARALELTRALFASFTEPGLSRVLARTADGRLVAQLAETDRA
jgi:hypothetical protein